MFKMRLATPRLHPRNSKLTVFALEWGCKRGWRALFHTKRKSETRERERERERERLEREG